ncbi:MAG: HAD family phosphatase [Deltaproteobacteria bacterium]|nr:HAD family phosphatase [Deltaproteobacteria bacterium]
MDGWKAFSMTDIKAVLFDFDGVLGRTMEDNYRAWVHAFSAHGLPFEREPYFLIEGFNSRRVAEYFLGDPAGRNGLIEELIDLKETHYAENASFSLYDGVEELINGLKARGIKLGLVSGASSKRLEASIGGFLGYFDAVVTGDRVRNCKPHPEPYLTAAKALSCAPSECVAVENAPMGITSAKGAGMRCVAITSTLPERALIHADRTFTSIMELKRFFCDDA